MFGQPTMAITLRELLAGPPTDFVSQNRVQYDEPSLSALAVAWALDTLGMAYVPPLMYVSQVDGNPALVQLTLGPSALPSVAGQAGRLVHIPANESPFLNNGGVNGDHYLCGLVGDTVSALAWSAPDALPFDVPEVVERSFAAT